MGQSDPEATATPEPTVAESVVEIDDERRAADEMSVMVEMLRLGLGVTERVLGLVAIPAAVLYIIGRLADVAFWLGFGEVSPRGTLSWSEYLGRGVAWLVVSTVVWVLPVRLLVRSARRGSLAHATGFGTSAMMAPFAIAAVAAGLLSYWAGAETRSGTYATQLVTVQLLPEIVERQVGSHCVLVLADTGNRVTFWDPDETVLVSVETSGTSITSC